jgi:hypothetical protein
LVQEYRNVLRFSQLKSKAISVTGHGGP